MGAMSVSQTSYAEYFCSRNGIVYLVTPLWFTTDKQAKAGVGCTPVF